MDTIRETGRRGKVVPALNTLRRAGELRIVMDRTLRKLGLNVTKYAILREAHRGPLGVTDIEASLGWYHGTTTVVIDTIIADGYLVKRRSENDGRVRLVSTTPAGDRLYQEATDELERALA